MVELMLKVFPKQKKQGPMSFVAGSMSLIDVNERVQTLRDAVQVNTQYWQEVTARSCREIMTFM